MAAQVSSSSTAMSGSISHQLCSAIVLLSIALLTPGRQVAAYALPRPVAGAGAGSLQAQLWLNELLNAGNEDNSYYGQQMKYQQQHVEPLAPNYFATKWPGLRDLLLTADYADDATSQDSSSREQQLNSRLLGRLRRISDNTDAQNALDISDGDHLTAMPIKKLGVAKLSTSAKERNIKKNVQYMSPCHFKICNMGRKRNAGSYVPY